MRKYLSRVPIRLHLGALGYLILMAAALVFTQLLRSPASSLFFWFLFLLLPFSVLYTVLLRLALKVYVSLERTMAEKLQPTRYEVKLINEFILPMPRLSVLLSLPEEDGVRCSFRQLETALLPLAVEVIDDTVTFRYRGTYVIGVGEIWVRDLLSVFSLRIDVDIFESVMVLPRRLREGGAHPIAVTDIPTDSARAVNGAEQTEIGNIRDYRMGDALKSIHWKLSAKAEEIQVKEYHTSNARSIYILADFARAERMEIAPQTESEEKASPGRVRRAVHLRGKEKKTFRAWRKAAREKYDAWMFRRRRTHGMSEGKAQDIMELDTLIRETAVPGPIRRAILARRQARAEFAEVETQEAAAPSPTPVSSEASESRRMPYAAVAPEYLADMDEYCADGVAETAITAVLREVEQGNACTLLWYDAREESGIASASLTSPEDFEAIYTRFATAPCAPVSDDVTALSLLVRESLNITIRIVTANLEPEALNRYAAVPAQFGGAGSGCVTEILLYNPESRYSDLGLRREYVASCQARLMQDGIRLTECTEGGKSQ